MATTDVEKELQQLESTTSTNKTAAYNDLLIKIINNSSSSSDITAANLVAYLNTILSDSVGIVASRSLLATFIDQLQYIKDPDARIEVGLKAKALLEPKVATYEEQDSQVKEILATAYESQEDYRASARILKQITLESSQRAISADAKAAIWIRIVRCYLEEDDSTSAASYLNRVKNVLPDVTSKATKLQFHLSQARILDAQRSFLDASLAYHSFSNEAIVDLEDRLQALSAAIVCAVLAPAGPARARTLARLYKDERCTEVEEYSILEKIFFDRLLIPAEVRAFAEKLKPHQLAQTADGSTVLDKAVLEHNLLATSRLYENIGFDELGTLLGIDADRTESYAAKMIEQKRLAGYIDQIDGRVYFEGEVGNEKKAATQHQKVVFRDIRRWDANIQALTEEVEKVSTMIQEQCPVSLQSSNMKGVQALTSSRNFTLHILLQTLAEWGG